jgi:hypothetical protein
MGPVIRGALASLLAVAVGCGASQAGAGVDYGATPLPVAAMEAVGRPYRVTVRADGVGLLDGTVAWHVEAGRFAAVLSSGEQQITGERDRTIATVLADGSVRDADGRPIGRFTDDDSLRLTTSVIVHGTDVGRCEYHLDDDGSVTRRPTSGPITVLPVRWTGHVSAGRRLATLVSVYLFR